MRSGEYWKRAALLREIAVQEGATFAAEEILKLYDDALNDIDGEIRKIQYNFQQRFGVDDDTAAYFLTNAQREENLSMLIEALEAAPDEKARERILDYIHRDGLSVRAYASRIERFDAVKQSIYARLKKLAVNETALLTGALRKAYTEGYYGMIDDTAKGLNAGISFGILNDDAIEEAVTAKWSGKRFSERVWTNTDKLAKETQEIVTRYLMSGRSLDKAAREVADRFEVSKFHATTLVHTETAHVHAMADKKAYEDLGVEEYKYLATLDYATCETCQPLDGKVFKLRDAKEGVNFPVMHPRCRCTSTMNIDLSSRRARDPLTGKNELVDGSMTYDEWVKSLTPEQKQALETTRLKESNKVADKEQYARYKKTLGRENVPKTFDLFQKVKYNEDTAEYDALKISYADKRLQSRIRSSYNLTIHEGKQGKHILGHNNYIDGRSYITVSLEEAQKLVKKYAGTGEIQRDGNNRWIKQELICADKDIGVVLNLKADNTPTSKFVIHYSKNGTHIVPTNRKMRGEE